MFQKFLVMAVVAVTAALAVPSASQAGMTFTFNESNFGLTGSNYGTILVQDSSDSVVGNVINAGTVKFTFAINPSRPTTLLGQTDRFQSIGINSSLASSIFSAPSVGYSNTMGWSPVPVLGKNQDGFGSFAAVFSGSGDAQRAASGVIIISGLGANGRVSNFNLRTDSPAPKNVFFAGHLVPYNNTDPSVGTGFVGASGRGTWNGTGDSTLATPAPAGLILAALGIPAFSLLRRIGRKTRVAVAS